MARFENLFQLNPDLVESEQNNPGFFEACFDSLSMINHDAAMDPIICGWVLRRCMCEPFAAGGFIWEMRVK